jgi:tRNA(Ile)-lysidine synthase
MLAAFQSFLQAQNLCQPHHRVGVAVSGGLDSMVLLHLFRLAGYAVEVLHVQFGLRGAESDDDARFIEAYCARHGIPFRLHRVDTKSYATKHGLSVQEAARNIRYDWFRQQLQQGLDCVATAHHQTDSVETFFINLLRGTGLDGLTGIPVRQNGVIRPLLFATRAGLEAFAAAEGLAWREDASNQTEVYLRNKIRRRLLPVLDELQPGWQGTFASTTERLAGAQALAADWQRQRKIWETDAKGQWVCVASDLLSAPAPVLLLWEAIKAKGFNYAVCKNAVSALQTSGAGRRFESESHILWIDREKLILTPRTGEDTAPVWIQETDTEAASAFGRLRLVHSQTEEIFSDCQVACLDAARLHFPLCWRRWQPGDRFQPLGMDHTKKVSDFLVDEKIPRFEKERVSVLESAGEIVWVVGRRISQRYGIGPETTRRLLVFFSGD